MEIIDIENYQETDNCYPLFFNTYPKSLKYKPGQTYETDLDQNYMHSLTSGFYFKLTRNGMKKDLNDAHKICDDDNNSNRIAANNY